MWRLGTFRERLLNVCANHRCRRSSVSAMAPNHAETSKTEDKSKRELGCLLCALQNLFVNYKYSQSRILPPEIVRKALSLTSEAFPMFKIGDACEAFEIMLESLHDLEIGNGIAELEANDETLCGCCSHTVFGFRRFQAQVCSTCRGAKVDTPAPGSLLYTSFVLRMSSELLLRAKPPHIPGQWGITEVLRSNLQSCAQDNPVSTCSCAKGSAIPGCSATCIPEIPEVFCLALCWPSEKSVFIFYVKPHLTHVNK